MSATAAETAPAVTVQDRSPAPHTLELLAVGALTLACVIAFVAWPVLPTYDLAHQLLWGRDLASGRLPELEAFRAPTQHPLTLLLGLVLGPLGEVGSRISVALVLAAYVFLVTGAFVFARASFSRLVGWAVALLVVSRLDYASLAIRSYIDVPYLAALVWAAALEAQRPRRGGAVWWLLLFAGLLRPEAWLLAGVYALWIIWGDPARRSWRAWVRPVAWAATAPVIWCITDLLLTGNPVFSLTYTSGSAAELDHQEPISRIPYLTVHFLGSIVHAPGLAAGALGFALAVWFVPRRAALPALLFASGIAGFAAIVAAGLAAIARYLAVSGLMLLVFAGFAIAGWTVLQRGRARTAWLSVAAVAVALGVGWTALHVNPGSITHDMDVRLSVTRGLDHVLDDPAVVAARRCGPVTVPNQKLLPETRLALGGARASEVLARSDPSADSRRRARRGVALVIASPAVLEHPAYTPFDQKDDPATIIGPPPGFALAAHSGAIAAYVRC